MARFTYKAAPEQRKKRPGLLARSDIMMKLGRETFTWLPYSILRDCLDIIFEDIVAALERGEVVDIKGLGRFERRYRQGRIQSHPRTGAPLKTEAIYTVKFFPDPETDARAGKAMLERQLADLKAGRW